MSTQDIKLTWLQEVLGVQAASPQPAPEAPDTPGVGTVHENAISIDFSAIKKKLLSLFSYFTGAPEDDKGVYTKRTKDDLEYQQKALEAAALIVDEGKKQAAILRINQRIEEIKAHAEALKDAQASVMGDSTETPSDQQKSDIFKKALEDRYGLKITVPKGFTNTHFNRIYDMMGTVPKSQVDHDKLKKLVYDSSMGTGAAYGNATIYMGDLGDATGAAKYSVDGKEVPVNWFDVASLHEMGHALDDAENIMDTHGSKSGCGGWKAETKDSLVKVFLKHYKATHAAIDALTDDVIRGAIEAGLSGKDSVDPPEGIDNDEWTPLNRFVITSVYPSCVAAKPFFQNAPVSIDGRCYLESYENQFWSYEHAARSKNTVRNYQWRAPGEWFAEVYAVSWLTRTKPSSSVDASIAAYMWQD